MKQLKHPSSGSKWRQQIERFVVVMALLIISGSAHAAGLTELNTLLSTVSGWLQVAGIAIVTLALMWCGYKWLWDNADVRDLGKILFGALLIGGAAEAAGILLA